MPLQNDFESSIKNITVDLADSGVPRATVMAMQGDKGTRFARITVLNGGHPVDLTNVYAVLRGVKKDGTTIFNGCEIENNKIIAELTQNILSVDGIGRYEIALYSSDPNTVDDQLQVISSFPFTIHVVKSSFDATEMESSNEWTVLNQAMQNLPLMSQLDEYVAEVHEAINDIDDIEGTVGDLSADVANVKGRVNTVEGLLDGHSVATSVPANAVFTDTTYSPANANNDGLMTSNQYTKLEGISSGAEVNQNAFSKVTIGTTDINAATKQDGIKFVAGNNVNITADTSTKEITIESSGGGSDYVKKTAHTGDGTAGGDEYQTVLEIDHADAPYKDIHPEEFSFDVYKNGLLDPLPTEQINIVPFDNFTSSVPAISGSGYIGPPDNMYTTQEVYIYASSNNNNAATFNVVLCNHVNDYITDGAWVNMYVKVTRDWSRYSTANYVELSLGEHVLYAKTEHGVTVSGAFQYNGETTLTLELQEHSYASLIIGITYSPTGEEHPTPYNKYYYYGSTKKFLTTYPSSYQLDTNLYLYEDGSYSYLPDVTDSISIGNLYRLPEPAPESQSQWGYDVSFTFYYQLYYGEYKIIKIWSTVPLALGLESGNNNLYRDIGDEVDVADDYFNFNESESYGYIAYEDGVKIETLSALKAKLENVSTYWKSNMVSFYVSDNEIRTTVAHFLNQCGQDVEKVYWRTYDFKTGLVKEKYMLIPYYNSIFETLLLDESGDHYLEFYTADGRGTTEPDDGQEVLVAKKFYVGTKFTDNDYEDPKEYSLNDINVYCFDNFDYDISKLSLQYSLTGISSDDDAAAINIAYNKAGSGISMEELDRILEDYATKTYVDTTVGAAIQAAILSAINGSY